MSLFFFSRRAYPHNKRLSHNPAKLTRHFRIDDPKKPNQLVRYKDQDVWADHVIQDAGAGDIVCFVHGYNNDHAKAMQKFIKIDQGLRATGQFDGTVIAFDWPADGNPIWAKPSPTNKNLLAYNSDKDDAERTAWYLVRDGLALVQARLKPGQKLHVIAHSMGARVVTRAFERISGDYHLNWKMDQVVFLAADIDSAEMEIGNLYANTMALRCKGVSNYCSHFDDALDVSKKFVNGGRDRLGYIGAPDRTHQNFQDIDCTAFYSQSNETWAFSDLKKSHTWFFESPAFFRDLAKTLGGKSKKKKRKLKA